MDGSFPQSDSWTPEAWHQTRCHWGEVNFPTFLNFPHLCSYSCLFQVPGEVEFPVKVISIKLEMSFKLKQTLAEVLDLDKALVKKNSLGLNKFSASWQITFFSSHFLLTCISWRAVCWTSGSGSSRWRARMSKMSTWKGFQQTVLVSLVFRCISSTLVSLSVSRSISQ